MNRLLTNKRALWLDYVTQGKAVSALSDDLKPDTDEYRTVILLYRLYYEHTLRVADSVVMLAGLR